MADIQLERDGDVAHIVFNRPQQRNALTQAMWQRLPGLIDNVERDRAVKVVVLRGIDASAFAAGADIAEFPVIYGTSESAIAANDAVQAAQQRLTDLGKPSIAMIQGACVGGGCGLALACDFRFADTTARFGITPARLGLAYSLPDTRRLVSAIGLARSRDMLYSARLLGAQEALEIGLIDRLLPQERLRDETRSYAAAIAANSQFAVTAMKRILRRIELGASDDDPEAERLFRGSFQGSDLAEGVAAFLEKRKPSFGGG